LWTSSCGIGLVEVVVVEVVVVVLVESPQMGGVALVATLQAARLASLECVHCRRHSLPALFRGHAPLQAFNVAAISLLQSLWHLASAEDASTRHASNDGSTRARRLRLGGAAASEATILRIIFLLRALPGSPILRARPEIKPRREVTASARIHRAPSRSDLIGLRSPGRGHAPESGHRSGTHSPYSRRRRSGLGSDVKRRPVRAVAGVVGSGPLIFIFPDIRHERRQPRWSCATS